MTGVTKKLKEQIYMLMLMQKHAVFLWPFIEQRVDNWKNRKNTLVVDICKKKHERRYLIFNT